MKAVKAFDTASCQGGIPRVALRAAVTLAQTLKQCNAEARAALPDAVETVLHMRPETAVAVTAALDACYNALLEHSLSCSWGAPLVPPPHRWFPGMAAAHPGAAPGGGGCFMLSCPPEAGAAELASAHVILQIRLWHWLSPRGSGDLLKPNL